MTEIYVETVPSHRWQNPETGRRNPRWDSIEESLWQGKVLWIKGISRQGIARALNLRGVPHEMRADKGGFLVRLKKDEEFEMHVFRDPRGPNHL